MSIRCTLMAALLSLAWPGLQAGAAEAPPTSAGVRAAIAPESQGAPAWHRVATDPYDLNNKQDALAFGSATTGWYGNGTGRIYRTDDAGDHWRLVWRHPGTYVRALDFVDADTGFMGNVGPGYFDDVSDARPLFVTHDGGGHWTAVAPGNGVAVKGICAIDVLKLEGAAATIRAGGRVGGPAGLMTSRDGGATWQGRDMGALTGMILDIHFVDAATGFIAGASQSDEGAAHARILKTTDGGDTWRAVYDSARAGDNNWKLSFPSARVGYATIMSYAAPADEARGYVVKTEDGGEHWRKLVVTRDHGWIPYGIAFLNERRGWVGGATGGYETRDGGDSWHPAHMGLATNKIRFVPRTGGGTRALAIGHDLFALDLPEEALPHPP